jgi:hypothetical protein
MVEQSAEFAPAPCSLDSDEVGHIDGASEPLNRGALGRWQSAARELVKSVVKQKEIRVWSR